MKRLHILVGLLGLAGLTGFGGCQPESVGTKAPTLRQQIDTLERENRCLADRNKQLTEQLAQRDKQIRRQGCMKTAAEHRFVVSKIELRKQSGPVNDDKTPGHDAIRLYLRPIDQHGHVIKALGQVTIELFDLSAPAPLLSKTVIPCKTIGSHWREGFLGYHYGFSVPIPAAAKGKELTARLTFDAAATGKQFRIQNVWKVE